MSIKRKVFVSYHHKNDQYYKDKLVNKLKRLCSNTSVNDGDIAENLSDNYIKRLIQDGYVCDASVLIVLIGNETYKRKHVDWEISAALSKKVGGYSGILGILLPSYDDYEDGEYNPDTIPFRLNANLESGYAKLYKWNSAFKKAANGSYYICNWIDEAYKRRRNQFNKINNTQSQMKYNKNWGDRLKYYFAG